MCDSPSKHVSFQELDKENDKVSIEARSALKGIDAGIMTDEMAENNYQTREQVHERLERAKQRASQLRDYEIKTRMRANNILNMR